MRATKTCRWYVQPFLNEDLSGELMISTNQSTLLHLVRIFHDYTLSVYGVATIRRLLQRIGPFCKSALLKRQYSAKETYNFKEPTNLSHPPIHS